MAMSVKEFLSLYFRQRHFDGMPDAVQKRFDGYVERKDFRGDMESWFKDLLARDGDGKVYKDKATGHYAHKELPDAEVELSESDWENFYLILQRVFINMDFDRGSLDKKTAAFLDLYFGAGKVFEPMPLDDATKNAVQRFFTEVLDDTAGYSLFNAYSGAEDSTKADYEEFKRSIQDGSYEQKSDVRKKLTRMIRNLQTVDLTEYRGFQDVGNKLNTLAMNGSLTQILNGLSQEKTPTHIDISKLKSRYRNILNNLHDTPKIAEDFKRFDGGKISGPLEEAIKKTDYTGKITEKDFVPEQVEDRKTLRQRIGDTAHNVYDDVFKKWFTLRRDHVYALPTTAKPIVDVMTSKNFNLKPTDGLEAIMDKSADIAKKVQEKSPKAAEHFGWFVQTMKSLSGTDAFKSALRNGHELHKLVANVWEKAVAEKKIEEAKTTMEVLKVMSYSLFDSRRVNTVTQSDFTLLSDTKMSYMQGNKPADEAIKVVAGALDKTIKFVVWGTGRVIGASVNLTRRIGVGVQRSDKKKYLKENPELRKAAEERDQLNAKDEETLAELREKQADPSETYDGIDDEIAFYEASIQDRNNAFDKQSKEMKEAYAELMGFWKLLQTGHTKTLFRISTKHVQKMKTKETKRHPDGKMQDWLKAYKEKYMDYAG